MTVQNYGERVFMPEQISSLLLALQKPKESGCKGIACECLQVYNILNRLFEGACLKLMISRNPMDFVKRPKPMNAGK